MWYEALWLLALGKKCLSVQNPDELCQNLMCTASVGQRMNFSFMQCGRISFWTQLILHTCCLHSVWTPAYDIVKAVLCCVGCLPCYSPVWTGHKWWYRIEWSLAFFCIISIIWVWEMIVKQKKCIWFCDVESLRIYPITELYEYFVAFELFLTGSTSINLCGVYINFDHQFFISVISFIPVAVPSEDTFAAMRHREADLLHSAPVLRAHARPCADRLQLTHCVRLRVVREFGLPDSCVDLLHAASRPFHTTPSMSHRPAPSAFCSSSTSSNRHFHHRHLHLDRSPSTPVSPSRSYSPVEVSDRCYIDWEFYWWLPGICKAWV